MSRCRTGCKWQVAGSGGHGGPRKDVTVIEVGLALVLLNQGLSNGWGRSAREKIQCMRGDKEFKGREREEGMNE